MLRRFTHVVAVAAAFLVLCGMGGTGGFERAPRVEKNFAVTVTDTAGNTINGEKFSWDGRIHFSGYLGMAEVSIPFDRIRELTVGEKKERRVRATAKLTDGTETSFDIDAKSRCYGESSFGSFMLQMDEIKSLVFKKN